MLRAAGVQDAVVEGEAGDFEGSEFLVRVFPEEGLKGGSREVLAPADGDVGMEAFVFRFQAGCSGSGLDLVLEVGQLGRAGCQAGPYDGRVAMASEAAEAFQGEEEGRGGDLVEGVDEGLEGFFGDIAEKAEREMQGGGGKPAQVGEMGVKGGEVPGEWRGEVDGDEHPSGHGGIWCMGG